MQGLNISKVGKGNIEMNKTLEQYLISALWSSCDNNDDNLDENYTLEDIHKSAIEQAEKDLDQFIDKAGDLILDMDETQLAHDFWLTRNHHGAGFWDRGLGEKGDKLTELAESFGECDIYVGDDNKLYFM